MPLFYGLSMLDCKRHPFLFSGFRSRSRGLFSNQFQRREINLRRRIVKFFNFSQQVTGKRFISQINRDMNHLLKQLLLLFKRRIVSWKSE